MMLVTSCIPFPFSAPCDDMLAMLICPTRWLYMHLYTLAYMSMHESYWLVCRPCFNTMKYGHSIQTYICPSWTPPFVCFLACLPFCLCLLSRMPCLPCLSCLSALCPFHMLFAHFPSIDCLLVSCLSLCMYTHGVRTLGARERSPKCKKKGFRSKHVDMSRVMVASRFEGLVFPI